MDASYTTYFHPLDLTSLKILIDDNYRYHSEYSIQIEDFFPLQNEVSKLKANSDIPSSPTSSFSPYSNPSQSYKNRSKNENETRRSKKRISIPLTSPEILNLLTITDTIIGILSTRSRSKTSNWKATPIFHHPPPLHLEKPPREIKIKL